MTTTTAERSVNDLRAPQNLEETGLRLDLVVQLLMKALHFAGELSGIELAERVGLTFPVIDPGVERMKVQRLCEIVGGTNLGPPSYRYRITQLGRSTRARISTATWPPAGAGADRSYRSIYAFYAARPRHRSRSGGRVLARC